MAILPTNQVDFSNNTMNDGDTLSALLGSLDIECSTVDTIGISEVTGMFISDLDPVFYVVLEGRCLFHRPIAKPIEFGRGDILILCEGDKHGLSHISASPFPRLDGTSGQGMPAVSAAKHSSYTRLLRVVLKHALPRVHPLWCDLPNPVIMKNIMYDESAPVLANTIRSMRHLQNEWPDGADAIMRSLGRVCFLEIIRKTINWPELADSRFSRVLNDPELAPVLAQVYRDPTRQWTLLMLANEAGISRSSFVRRFKQLMGMSFTEWIVDLRMRLAQKLLSESDLGLEQVAQKVGYSNAASFSVAFKRWAGHYPSFGRGRPSPKDDSKLAEPPE